MEEVEQEKQDLIEKVEEEKGKRSAAEDALDKCLYKYTSAMQLVTSFLSLPPPSQQAKSPLITSQLSAQPPVSQSSAVSSKPPLLMNLKVLPPPVTTKAPFSHRTFRGVTTIQPKKILVISKTKEYIGGVNHNRSYKHLPIGKINVAIPPPNMPTVQHPWPKVAMIQYKDKTIEFPLGKGYGRHYCSQQCYY